MKLNKGRYTNSEPINQPQGTWLKGSKNLSISQSYGSISSEYGFKKLINRQLNLDCCGLIRLNANSYAIFLKSTDGRVADSIGIIEDDSTNIQIVYEERDLNFDKDFPIYGTATLNYKQERIVAFASEVTPLRIINIDDPETDINKLNVFPDFELPVLDNTKVELGGNLKVGLYFFITRYKSDTGQTTPFQFVNNSISIHTQLKTEEEQSRKQIKLNFTNIDTNFDVIELACIKNTNGELITTSVKEVRIENQSSISINYSGNEEEKTLLLEEIINPYTPYTKVGEIAQHEDNLYLADLKSTQLENHQLLVNNINVKYNLEEVDNDDLKKGELEGSSFITYMPDEVYALYINFRFPNGIRTSAYHIPGRSPIATDLEEVVVPFTKSTGRSHTVDQTTYKPKYTLISTYNSATRELGYWENENEFYPNKPEIWGDLAGKKVRHHRMPDYREVLNISNNKHKLIKLELNNITLPEGATSYEIFYAKRTEENSLIKGYDVAQTYAYTNKSYGAGSTWDIANPLNNGGNWDRQYTTGTGVQSTTSVRPENFWRRLKVHSFDSIKDKLSLNIDYIKILNKLTLTNINDKKIAASGTNRGLQTSALLSNLDGDTIYDSLSEANILQYFKVKPNTIQFIPENSIVGNVDNRFGEDHYSLKGEISGAVNFFDRLTTGEVLSRLQTFSTGGENNIGIIMNTDPYEDKEVSFIICLCSYKNDLYTSYKNQILISTGLLGNTSTIEIEGDSYLGVHTFFTAAPTTKDQTPTTEELEQNPETGSKQEKVFMIRKVATYFNNNPHFRQIINEDYNSYFDFSIVEPLFGKEELTTFISQIGRFQPSTKYVYNKGFQQLNEFNPIFPNDEKPRADNFPFRIVKSIKFDSDNIDNNWFRYLPGDYYDIQKNKERIVKLISRGRRLLIHTEEALLQTVSRENLQAGDQEITLTTGELFRQLPVEIVESDVGFAGLQHKFAQLNTEVGYLFGDVNQSKIFIFNDKIQEISKQGISLELNEILNQRKDNPYQEEGVVVGYDNLYNRLFLTQLKGEESFTLSYSLDIGAWEFEHDYLPNQFLYFRNNRVLSLKASEIYEHNQKDSNVFYDTNPIECKFILSLNPEYQLDKQLYQLNWITTSKKGQELLRDKTFKSIRIYNNYQDTGEIELIPFESLNSKGNIRRIKNSWNFNKLRSQSVDFYTRDRLVSKYFIIELTYVREEPTDMLLIEDIDFKLKVVKR